MLRKIKDYVKKWNMLESGDRVIAGVSGGADSVCLLFVLLELQKEIPFELAVVHVNHGLRGEAADRDEAYVRELCGKYALPCVVYSENVELIAKKRKQSLEEAGREVRREAFRKTMEMYGGTKTALAHHKDDNAETFLMNLARGSGLRGLGGMLPINGEIIRPLLAAERREIEQYLEENNISYCTDETNTSDDYTRNRIRNHVLPYMQEQINAKSVSHINDTMENFRELEAYLNEQAQQAQRICVSASETGYLIRSEAFASVANVIRPLVIRQVLRDVSKKEKDIGAAHLRQIQQLFGKQNGRRIDLPYQMEAERVYEGVEIRNRQKKPEEKNPEIQLTLEGTEKKRYRWGGRTITCRVFEAKMTEKDCSEKVYTKWFDYDIIEDALSVRMRKSGDFIVIHRDGRRQKLKSYFINEKIPQQERDRIPLIAEGNRILWIVGYRVSDAYRINENTKRILEIQIEEGEEYGRDN